MRLRKIKLAGFKSFVDPTTLHVPSNLVAIIGPNGCGKSNVIDAVRWVMGESSAKTLRGESMADVIFNGSAGRKPIGQASVELVFDNSEQRIGGNYAQFNEIAVRRQVTRDGQSHYLINNSRCRRKDITDLFLGTGLGPRSYSIIEQGMISRVIEAKPEELRLFLEEAAGISLYKARRKEAETRIRHTRENLERLDDLRGELDSQLKRLQRQAEAAERYKTLKAEERDLKGKLQAFRLRRLAREIKTDEAGLRRREVALEERLVALRRTEADLEQQREAQQQGNEQVNQGQSEVFNARGEVKRLDQAIQHVREQRRTLKSEAEQAQQRLDEALGLQQSDTETRAQLQLAIDHSSEALATEELRQEQVEATRSEAEAAMGAWQQAWEQYHRDAAEPQREAEVQRARLNHLEDQSNRAGQRLERLAAELSGLDASPHQTQVAELQGRLEQGEEDLAELRERVEESGAAIIGAREDNQRIAAQLDDSRRQLQHERGRLASLETLQQAALGQEQGQVRDWLERRGLADAQRLAQTLTVAAGWEKAVEVVLGPHLEAVCSPRLGDGLGALDDLVKGSVTLFDTDIDAAGSPGAPVAEPLSAQVKAPWPLDNLLAGVGTVPDLAAAAAGYAALRPGQSLVTPDGIWLGRGWVRVVREQDQRSGVLGREQALRELRARVPELEQQAGTQQQAQERGNLALRELEQQRSDRQRELDEGNRGLGEVRTELGRQRNRLEQVQQRRTRIEEERDELQEQAEEAAIEAEQGRERLHAALSRMEQQIGCRAELEQQREQRRRNQEEAVQAERVVRDQVHRLAMEGSSLRTRLEEIGRHAQRTAAQVEQWQRRLEQLRESLEAAEDPVENLEIEREEWLTRHIEAEAQLTLERDQLAAVDNRIGALDTQRQQQEQVFSRDKELLQADHLSLEGQRTRWQTLAEQMEEAGADLEALVAALPEQVDEAAWQARLEQIERSVQRLGAINLAAIDEYRVQGERKRHLDTQHADLIEALETLEGAIRRIDKETRERFKTTFDRVNAGVQRMFPRLFGGGDAYLALTDSDPLDAGVTIMARPPGKRNATIHMLSGGEKALTAVALVFAIFELNPAPFCMLDEVDAPLDDANVTRFGRMVQQMSENTQFIFVTHNKVTMEMAEQLTGVTMHEPGVSRLVSVDIDEALKLADV